MRPTAACLVLLLVSATWAGGQETARPPSSSQRISTWGGELALDPGVMVEMMRYAPGGVGLDTGFARIQAGKLRAALLLTAQAGLARIAAEGCHPRIEVTFPEPDQWGGPEPGRVEREFLRGVVRTEAVACFPPALPPAEALDLYTSPEFREAAESRIEEIWKEGDDTCVATGGVAMLLSPTLACNRVTRLVTPDVAAEHSQVIRNGEGDGLQPVFFKESLKTFLSMPGGLALHYVNYSRSADLGPAGRWVAPGRVREAQERQFDLLRRRMGG